ncbi:hypothetical protein PAXINDRAFT_103564, partial [Paxillus involutus ATCC 200175]
MPDPPIDYFKQLFRASPLLLCPSTRDSKCNLGLIIRDDPNAVGDYIANYIAKRINDFAPTPDKPFVLGLPTGSSPLPTYKALTKLVKDGELSFKNVVTFNMDEYVGLPRDHSESYHTFMFREFFSHIDIPPSQVHILDGNAQDLIAECNAYEQRINRMAVSSSSWAAS